MTRTLKLVLVLAATLTLAACGTGPGIKQASAPAASQEKTTNATTTRGPTAQAGSGGEQAPNFALTTLDGKPFDLKKERGKVVALYIMAGSCGTCTPEAQSWSKLYPAYKDKGLDLLVISVDPNDTPQTIEDYRQAEKIRPLPWAIDGTGEVSRSLGIQALSSTVIINREGRITYRDSAPTEAETLESELEKVL